MHEELAYLIIIIGVIVEGEIVVILAGIFAHLGSLDLFTSFLATVAGGGVKSVLGYCFGYYLNTHHSHTSFLRNTEYRINYFLPSFKEKPFWSIFLSRFLILGLHWFSIVYSGYKKVSLRTYIKSEGLSLVLWAWFMLLLGFFFSYTALSISRDIRKFLGVILVCFIAFFLLEKLIAFMIELSGIQKNKNKDIK